MGPDGLAICQSHDGCFADNIAVNSITVTLCFCPEALRVCWHVLVTCVCACMSVCVCVVKVVFFSSIPAVHNWQVMWWHSVPCCTPWPRPFFGNQRSWSHRCGGWDDLSVSAPIARQHCSCAKESFVSTFLYILYWCLCHLPVISSSRGKDSVSTYKSRCCQECQCFVLLIY